MKPFLRGFADELIKIAGAGDSWSNAPRPPSAAPAQLPKAPSAPTPDNAGTGVVSKQRMEWSPSAKKDTWQPSPGFRLEQPKPQPAPAPKATGVVKAKPKDADPAFENAEQRGRRKASEYLHTNFNRNLEPRKNESNVSYDKLTVKPGEKGVSPMQGINDTLKREEAARKVVKINNRVR